MVPQLQAYEVDEYATDGSKDIRCLLKIKQNPRCFKDDSEERLSISE